MHEGNRSLSFESPLLKHEYESKEPICSWLFPLNSHSISPGGQYRVCGFQWGDSTGERPVGFGSTADLYRNWSNAKATEIPDLVSSASLHQWSVNLAYLDLRYRGDQIRSRLMPAFGTYMERNYGPGEPRLLEASLGYKPWKSRDFWVDAGLLGSPFTNESPLSRDQPTYTRSLSAEFVPYFLSGVRLGTTWGPQLSTYLYAVNGWQQAVDRVPGQALVVQVEYRPAAKILFNVNFFRGREQHATQRLAGSNQPSNGLRTLWDAYVIFRPTPQLLLTSSFYHGTQNNDRWNQANLIIEKKWGSQGAFHLRVEALNDTAGVVLPRINPSHTGLIYGYSGGITYKVQDHLMLRGEFRNLVRTQSTVSTETWPYWTLSASMGL
ncbi:MAG: outer membrane beta-barrel protein [Bacteroidota bacterium]